MINHELSKQLLEFKTKEVNLFSVEGLISRKNYTNKKSLLILFINNRLVDCPIIKRSIESIYFSYSLKKASPFVYMDLKVDPKDLDVNVHPTKKEVHLLREDDILIMLCDCIQNALFDSESDTVLKEFNNSQNLFNSKKRIASPLESKVGTPSPKNMVRTDSKDQLLHKYYNSMSSQKSNLGVAHNVETILSPLHQIETTQDLGSMNNDLKTTQNIILEEYKDIVLSIMSKIKTNCNHDVKKILEGHTFVGLIDSENCLIQYNTKLIMLDYQKIIKELFQQKILLQFPLDNSNVVQLDPPINLKDIIKLALELNESSLAHFELTNKTNDIYSLTIEKREILFDLFSIKIQNDQITSLPLLITGYSPQLFKLPQFIYELCTKVIWESKEKSLIELLQLISEFYTPTVLIDFSESQDKNQKELQKYNIIVENILFPEMRQDFFPSYDFVYNISKIKELVDLPSLYKIFERC